MKNEFDKISKKEINRYTNDKTYKPDVNLRAPKHKPYKRKKKADFIHEAEDEAYQDYIDDIEFYNRYEHDDLVGDDE